MRSADRCRIAGVTCATRAFWAWSLAWVMAVCTVIVCPVAIYMSWRFFSEWRDGASKFCPRCAERIKAAALVCRHCNQQLDANIPLPGTRPVG